jgi:hypothetical protein
MAKKPNPKPKPIPPAFPIPIPPATLPGALRARVIAMGSIATACIAIVGAWHLFGFPEPAWSSDVKRLDRGQAEIAVETYNTKLRSLIVVAPPKGSPAHDVWQQELKSTQDQLKRAEDRKIELGK